VLCTSVSTIQQELSPVCRRTNNYFVVFFINMFVVIFATKSMTKLSPEQERATKSILKPGRESRYLPICRRQGCHHPFLRQYASYSLKYHRSFSYWPGFA
jgi:hypothetical protein